MLVTTYQLHGKGAWRRRPGWKVSDGGYRNRTYILPMERFPLSQGEPLSSILGTVSYFACNFSIHSETTRDTENSSGTWLYYSMGPTRAKNFSIVRLTVQVLTVLEVLISSVAKSSSPSSPSFRGARRLLFNWSTTVRVGQGTVMDHACVLVDWSHWARFIAR
jgi:hypothetical protein